MRDGGSFSYASCDNLRNYFDGVAAHNTVQFDGREQMPRIGRFLFGEWPQTDAVGPIEHSDEQVTFKASYLDWRRASHLRRVILRQSGLFVEDHVEGFEDSATLRWRLLPGKWHCSGTVLHGPGFRISVRADVPIVSCELVSGEESRFYLQKTSLPVLQVTVNKPGLIISEVESVG